MAELAIKIGTVGPDPAYQDGDILAAFNSRFIRCAHAQHICHVKNAGGGRRAHRDNNHVARDFFEHTHQYRFERVSRTEAKRIDLATLEEVVFDNRLKIVNGEKFCTNVPLFIERRLRHDRHRIFGTLGSEVWYGGRKDFSNAKLDLVWNAIETKTPLREADHQRMLLAGRQLRSHLFVTCDDFNETVAQELVAADRDLTDPDNPVLVRKRLRHLPWKDFIDSREFARIEDKTRSVDLRNSMSPLTRAAAVKNKGSR